MKIALSKSSLLAAIEISKDKGILNFKDFKYLESIKNSFDIKNGKQLIKIIGLEKIQELNNNTFHNYQLVLREILMKYLKNEKPGFLLRVTSGRERFLDYIDENFEQLLNEAGLYDNIDLTKEGREIGVWWDSLSEFVRDLEKDRLLDLGRDGEEKTIQYEIEKLKKLNIQKTPKWISYEDNSAGYDVLSWDNEKKEHFIAKHSEILSTFNQNQ